jgi:hypothetical protein
MELTIDDTFAEGSMSEDDWLETLSRTLAAVKLIFSSAECLTQ